MNEREAAENSEIFRHAQADVRGGLGRTVRGEPGRSLGRVRNEAG